MPFATVFCACNGRTDNPLDHWSNGACKIPRGPHTSRLHAITQNEVGDVLHAGGRLTATRTMACTRAWLIEDLEDGLYLDPRAHETAYEGTLEHAEFTRSMFPGFYKAVRFPVAGRPEPRFLGVPLAGEIDFLSADMAQLDDLKTHGPARAGVPWKLGKDTGPEDEVQVNLYRLALKQMELGDPQTMRLWHKWRAPARPLPDTVDVGDLRETKEAKSRWWYTTAQVRDEAWIAAVKPFGSYYCIGELFDMRGWVLRQMESGKTLREAMQGVPMIGEPRFFGQGCTLYCSPGVRDKCFLWAGRAPTWAGAEAAYGEALQDAAVEEKDEVFG